MRARVFTCVSHEKEPEHGVHAGVFAQKTADPKTQKD
jgi:hypothetical protein